MAMKRILLVAPFTLLPDEMGNNRFRYIAELLATKHHVTFVTSTFNHPEKKFRTQKAQYNKLPYTLVLLAEKGYQKNVGIARVLSHRQFTKNLERFLVDAGGRFDYVYSAFPTINAASVCARFAKQQRIPFILDVQDVWPESILVYFSRFKGLSKWLLKPLTRKANAVYAQADVLVAVSQTYLDRAASVNTTAAKKIPLYIGIDVNRFDEGAKMPVDFSTEGDELIGVYAGTLSHSYDMSTLIKAAAQVKSEGTNLRILILGHGPFQNQLKKEAEALNAPVTFQGLKPFAEMCGYLSHSHFAVHSIVGASQSSITNKFADYCAAGLPVLNSSQNPEIRQLIEDHGLGINHPSGNIEVLAAAIQHLATNPTERIAMGRASRLFAEEFLDRKKTYAALLPIFE